MLNSVKEVRTNRESTDSCIDKDTDSEYDKHFPQRMSDKVAEARNN